MTAVSSRGLFRATGKKSKPVHVRDLTGDIVKIDALEREKDDFYRRRQGRRHLFRPRCLGVGRSAYPGAGIGDRQTDWRVA